MFQTSWIWLNECQNSLSGIHKGCHDPLGRQGAARALHVSRAERLSRAPAVGKGQRSCRRAGDRRGQPPPPIGRYCEAGEPRDLLKRHLRGLALLTMDHLESTGAIACSQVEYERPADGSGVWTRVSVREDPGKPGPSTACEGPSGGGWSVVPGARASGGGAGMDA